MNNIILQCINLNKFYQDGEIKNNILTNISFNLKKGDIAGIIGKSGSGKSTLLHILAGLDNPTSGIVLFNGKSLHTMSSNETSRFRNMKLGFIYQFHHLLLDFNVLENVSLPLLIAHKNKKKSQEIAYEMLTMVNLETKINKYPSELSGGEKQRVAIARALINKPSLIIADEPTGNLDQYNTDIIFNLMLKFNSNYNTSILIVTHDIFLIKNISILFEIKNSQLVHYQK